MNWALYGQGWNLSKLNWITLVREWETGV